MDGSYKVDASIPGPAALAVPSSLAAKVAREYERTGKGKYRPDRVKKLSADWTGKRVFPYSRVSTDEQQEDGFSLEAQRGAVEEHGLSKGGTIVEPHRCAAVSAEGRVTTSTEDHVCDAEVPLHDTTSGKFFRMDEPAKERKRRRLRWAMLNPDAWDIMLVKRRDRIHRSTRNWCHFMDWCIKHDKFVVELVGVGGEEAIDMMTSKGRFVAILFAGLAEMEPLTNVERALPVRDELVQAGVFAVGFRAPYGLAWSMPGRRKQNRKLGGGSLVHDGTVDGHNGRTEAENVRAIFERRAEGATVAQLTEWMGWCGCRGRNAPVDAALAAARWGEARAESRSKDPGDREANRSLYRVKQGRRRFAPGRLTRRCPGEAAVVRILANPVYFGLMKWRGKVWDVREPRELRRRDGTTYRWSYVPLVTEDLWNRAQLQEKRPDDRVIPVKVWLQRDMAAALDAAATQRLSNASRVVRSAVERHVATAALHRIKGRQGGEDKAKFTFKLRAAQVAALKERAAALGSKNWSAALRGCIVAELRGGLEHGPEDARTEAHGAAVGGLG